MPNYVYENFDEVEESIKKAAPKIVYKYRSDWNNLHHKEIITKQLIWFTAPRDLNDTHDIRTPLRFNVAEIEDPRFLEKLKKYTRINNPNIGFTERELNSICENKLDEIRRDPKVYFENIYRQIRDSELFDRIGLFSCTKDELNETMWAHYGNHQTGFVVGFNTVEFSRNLRCGMGLVKYSDEIPSHSFINSKAGDDSSMYFQKSKNWEYEQEFRFFSIDDEKLTQRQQRFPVNCVSEFLLGSEFPRNQLDDIMNSIKKTFPIETPIYQIHPQVSGFGLTKTRID